MNVEIAENKPSIEKGKEINNNLLTEQDLGKQQNHFLETTLGKIVNTAMDVGLRFVLPDLIENQVIEIKDTLMQEGLKEGINKTVQSAIDFGKSAAGIFTGKFENIGQVQNAVEKGGLIDSLSTIVDGVVDRTIQKGNIPKEIGSMIKKGKNVLLDNISVNIENMLTDQVKTIEKLGGSCQEWKGSYQNKNFDKMEKEYDKIEKYMKQLIPLQQTLTEAKQIENIHNLIKNNGKKFDLSQQEIEAAKKLV